MKIKYLLLLAFWPMVSSAQSVKTYHVKSPDGKIDASVNIGSNIQWSVKYNQTDVITPSAIGLVLSNGAVLGNNPVVKSNTTVNKDESFSTPIYKRARVRDNYNQLTLKFKGDYGVIFRAYNDGVAYRFVTSINNELTIKDEEANFNFADDNQGFFPLVNDYRNKDKFNTSFEAHYDNIKISAMKKDVPAFLPVVVSVSDQIKAAVMEADIEDYPGMYLTNNGTGLHGVFAAYPAEQGTGGYSSMNYVVKQRADYIAKTSGTRSFPWRAVVISTEDKQLADNDMAQKLAAPSRIKDISWVKPGKVAWDWWNDWNISHVSFKAGINVPTYKYYIDFAAANKLEYIIIDEGWSSDTDLNKISPDINIPEVVAYAKEKNVGVILWASWFATMQQTDAVFDKYSKMGVKGFKIDFIDRDDQFAVRSLYEIAQKAADHHLLVDYHGMYKPSGMQRTFPHILNFEGVKGLENMKWGVDNQPGYDVSAPFVRMLAGPMDYTPGGMRNAPKGDFRPVNNNPMTQGTRTHQLAMYPIFEAPLQMLADNPTIYMREQESTDFIASVPTTFDETVALDGKVGQFISLARRKGNTWYAGTMTNWDAREITIDLSFLGEGSYKAVIFEDGINANHNATDYVRKELTVSGKDKLTVKMASGGGWAARFEKQ
ncbi:glycoside hydrolase family 97 protein [Mucilaginibacter terrenus]|uniref:Glycoside hydrolase family 97 protein n=1 Tax=Mucilaginibacter terrenus TaxID=2482727 RepID=A0A3E2NNU7_9SPHI|nr:glycoside hydrolase family 97 protein [Mucilaginibacter terrenus]RFZ82631.1 glycoside hydrolase family 97 protein [Mucilaginibacter terrenus]